MMHGRSGVRGYRAGCRAYRGREIAVAVMAFALLPHARPGALDAQVVPGAAQPNDTVTLNDALTIALERDPRLAAAQAGVDAAFAGRVQARAAWLPALSTSGVVTRFQEPMVVAPLHGFDPGSPPAFDRTLAQGRLTLGWTVFDGGARRARVAAAGARLTSADAGVADARVEATLDVIEAYLRVLATRDAVAAQRTREMQLEEERARAERLVTEGAAPRLELLRAGAEQDAVRAEGVGTGAAQIVAEAELARLLGIPAERVAAAALIEVRPVAAPLPVSTAPAPDHPLLLEARGRVAGAEALVREAKSAWLPQVHGTGALVEYGSGSGDFSGEWQAGLQVEYAIFAGGARRARADEAQAEARRAAAQERAVEDALGRAISQAQAAVAEAEARALALASAVVRFDELARVEALALQEGSDVQADYLRALAGLHRARVGLADARRAVVLTRARLARAQGVLDEAWTRIQLEIER
ncbi:MAG: TolC family protein [Gemmatimonadetes bacterium]|nr:TolC family protein [Gemmatimonadota bacterium]